MDVIRILTESDAWSPAVSLPVAPMVYVPLGRLVEYGQLTAKSLLGAAGLIVNELPVPVKTVDDAGSVMVTVAFATWYAPNGSATWIMRKTILCELVQLRLKEVRAVKFASNVSTWVTRGMFETGMTNADW